jgi:hypothetical protein
MSHLQCAAVNFITGSITPPSICTNVTGLSAAYTTDAALSSLFGSASATLSSATSGSLPASRSSSSPTGNSRPSNQASLSSSPTSAPNPSNTITSSKNNSDNATKIGIGVGVPLGVILLASLCYFFWRQHRKHDRELKDMRQRLSMVEGGAQYGYNKAELSAEEAKRSATHELEGPVKPLPSHELEGSPTAMHHP